MTNLSVSAVRETDFEERLRFGQQTSPARAREQIISDFERNLLCLIDFASKKDLTF